MKSDLCDHNQSQCRLYVALLFLSLSLFMPFFLFSFLSVFISVFVLSLGSALITSVFIYLPCSFLVASFLPSIFSLPFFHPFIHLFFSPLLLFSIAPLLLLLFLPLPPNFLSSSLLSHSNSFFFLIRPRASSYFFSSTFFTSFPPFVLSFHPSFLHSLPQFTFLFPSFYSSISSPLLSLTACQALPIFPSSSPCFGFFFHLSLSFPFFLWSFTLLLSVC